MNDNYAHIIAQVYTMTAANVSGDKVATQVASQIPAQITAQTVLWGTLPEPLRAHPLGKNPTC